MNFDTALRVFVLMSAGLGLSLDFCIGSPPCTTDVLHESGACYWRENEKLTWEEAYFTCTNNEGNLAVVDREQVHSFLEDQGLLSLNKDALWIGLTDLVTRGVFRWTNGRVLGWNKWQVNAPHDDNNNPENCASYNTGMEWDDITCTSKNEYLCQSVPKDFFCLDSDSSCAPWINVDITSQQTETHCPLEEFYDLASPPNPRSCKVQCVRAVHIICRAYEIISNGSSISCRGTSVSYQDMHNLNCDNPHLNTTMYIRNFDAYGIVNNAKNTSLLPDEMTWNESKVACALLGKRLLTVRSPAENMQLGEQRSWIDLTNEGSDRAYHFSDGSVPLYTNWSADGLTSFHRTACVIRLANGGWTMMNNCNREYRALCEDNNTRECHPNPCQNRGTCRQEGESIECTCVTGYMGVTCTEQNESASGAPLACINTPCLHGASCIDVDHNAICQCESGFEGTHCEIDVHRRLVYLYAALRFNVEYNVSLANPALPSTRNFKAPIKQALDRQLFTQLGTMFQFLNILTLRRGSVIVVLEMGLYVNKTFSIKELNMEVREILTSVMNGLANQSISYPDPDYTEMLKIEPARDYCMMEPCQNGGTCNGAATNYTCTCTEEYYGEDCKPAKNVEMAAFFKSHANVPWGNSPGLMLAVCVMSCIWNLANMVKS